MKLHSIWAPWKQLMSADTISKRVGYLPDTDTDAHQVSSLVVLAVSGKALSVWN